MRIKLTVCYDGTNYCGWQVQKNGVSVQSVLVEAISALTGERVNLTGSGRTDAGVHALGQVADFKVEKCTIPPSNYAKALNTILPDDIKVLSSCQVSDDFNSRKSAKRKTYEYSFYTSDVLIPLKERYAYCVDGNLDFDGMGAVCDMFCGEHDFKCFVASGSSVKSTVRTIYSAKILPAENGFVLQVCGNGFLYNMVRICAGLTLAVGQGKLSLAEAKAMIDGKNRKPVVKTLPAKALCLTRVEYD